MIVANLQDPVLRSAASRAARPDEDVIVDASLAVHAMASGFPRLVIQAAAEGASQRHPALHAGIPTLVLTRATLARWEGERRVEEPHAGKVHFLAGRIRSSMEGKPTAASWVDRTPGELGRASGAPLPPALHAFGRRVLEFPSHYVDLQPLADICGLSRGALKARFRRRRLASPYTYLRWFRMIACAHVLSDRRVTIAQAAARLRFTSDGNLCRAMLSLTGMRPTEARTPRGWTSLLLTFAWQHLGPESRAAWEDLEDLFLRWVA